MSVDLDKLRQMAGQAREYTNYAIDVYDHIDSVLPLLGGTRMGVPQHLYDTIQALDDVEPHLYNRNNLGQLQLLVVAGTLLTTVAGIVYSIYQKATADKAQAAVELQKLQMIQEGTLDKSDLTSTPKDTIGDTLDKIRSLLLIVVAIIAVVSITNVFKH